MHRQPQTSSHAACATCYGLCSAAQSTAYRSSRFASMARTNQASGGALSGNLSRIRLDGAAAEPEVLTQIITSNALFPSRRALMPLLDGRSLARLNACARAFGKRDETSGRSFCENVARGRVLPLMRAHLEGVRSIGGEVRCCNHVSANRV